MLPRSQQKVTLNTWTSSVPLGDLVEVQMVVQEHMALPPTWEAQIEFQSPGFSLAKFRHLGSEPGNGRFFFPCLSKK